MTLDRSRVSAFLRHIRSMDRALVAAGFPAISPWWWAEIERFLWTGRRRWIIRAGRRAGKSSTLCRLAVAWALWGWWAVPMGDVAVVPFISVSKDEASARLRTIEAILNALEVSFEKRSEDIELVGGRRVVFEVRACSIRAAVGFTAIAVFGDEVALWENRETGANPAPQVIGQIAPTMATVNGAFMALSSSPFGREDYHCELFEQGDTDHQVASFGATWECNPTISEERTHELEPDPKLWANAYAALTRDTVSNALPEGHLTATVRPVPDGVRLAAPAVFLDFSSGRGDAVAWAAGRWAFPTELPHLTRRVYTRLRDANGDAIFSDEPILDSKGERIPNPRYSATPPLFVFGPIESQVGAFWQSVTSEKLVARIASDCRAWGAQWVIGDQASSYALASMFGRYGIHFHSIAWTNPNKVEAIVRLRRWLRDGQLILPEPVPGTAAERLLRELRALKEKVLPSGSLTYDGGREHDDHAATLITAAIADSLNLLSASPTAPRRFGINYDALPDMS